MLVISTAGPNVLRVIPTPKKTGIKMKYPMTCQPHGKTKQ
jgi:hypothetical protein